MANFLQGVGIATEAQGRMEAEDVARERAQSEASLVNDYAKRTLLFNKLMPEVIRAFMAKKAMAGMPNRDAQDIATLTEWAGAAPGMANGGAIPMMPTIPSAAAPTKFNGLYDDTKMKSEMPSVMDGVVQAWQNPLRQPTYTAGPDAATQMLHAFANGGAIDSNGVMAYRNGGKVKKKKDKKWIQSAIKHPGALHKQMGVPEGKKIPAGALERAAKAGGKLGKRARLAQTLRGFGDGGEVGPETFMDKLRERFQYYSSALKGPEKKKEGPPAEKPENSATRALRRRVDQAEEDAGVTEKKKHGGVVHGPGSGTSDSVPATIGGTMPARLSNGEYVIPADVVNKFGKDYFDQMVQKHHRRV